MAGHKRPPRTGELSRRRLAAAQTPEARFTAAADLLRSTAARMSRKRQAGDASPRASAVRLLEDATAGLQSLAASAGGDRE